MNNLSHSSEEVITEPKPLVKPVTPQEKPKSPEKPMKPMRNPFQPIKPIIRPGTAPSPKA